MSVILIFWWLFFLIRIAEDSCQDVFRKFHKTLQWTHTRSPTTDLGFGLSLARGVIKRSNYSHGANHIEVCSSLQFLSGHADVYNRVVLKAVACDDLVINRHLLNDILSGNQPIRRARTLLQYLENIDEGVPSRELSDVCLAQILSTKSCATSKQCIGMLSCKNQSSGYHKTHQILFALLLASQGCESRLGFDLSMRVVLANLCSSTLNEIRAIIGLQHPELLRDLFLEQTLFCSLAGFSEFFNHKLISKILEWQTSAGCFTADNIIRPKECSNHMTGLGIAYISVIINFFGLQ